MAEDEPTTPDYNRIAEHLAQIGIVNARPTTPEERRLARQRDEDLRQARWKAYRRFRNERAIQMLRDRGMGGELSPSDDESLQEYVEPSTPDWD